MKQSDALADIIPTHSEIYVTKANKGDLSLITELVSWNACLLKAMASPGLPRLGECPAALELRNGLATIPEFRDTDYVADAGRDTLQPETYLVFEAEDVVNKRHLTVPLTQDQVLHVARRVGFSPKSLGLNDYLG